MKINRKNPRPKYVKFSDINEGEIYVIANHVYMKIVTSWRFEEMKNSVNLEEGMLYFHENEQLVVEQSQTGATSATFTPGTGAQYAAVALPLVRKVFGQIAAKEFVSVLFWSDAASLECSWDLVLQLNHR